MLMVLLSWQCHLVHPMNVARAPGGHRPLDQVG